ncbi:MAG TPA: hypothetical protein VHW96_07560 [Solirubrobacteraceae bacterium]|jgi:hypothetical protein|nr:hypothetical protein [Solirubrobacteraceae bacterium]
MTVDLAAAQAFIDTHGRLLDRRRHALLTGERDGDADRAAVLAALEAYRNPDGGYGWGLEPDLRSPDSQPAAAGHAFEVFAEARPASSPHAAALCDWLDAITLPDGGLPFVLSMSSSAGVAPWFAGGEPALSSLQITAFVAAAAHRVAAHDPAVAGHPWLERATTYCLDAIAALDGDPFAYALAFSIRLLDALHDRQLGATAEMDALASHVPADGRVPVTGGAEGETLRPLDIAPDPGRPSRALVDSGAVTADLRRLADGQRDDGGWTVDYLPISPAGSLDWRGYATVKAIATLRRNGALG